MSYTKYTERKTIDVKKVFLTVFKLLIFIGLGALCAYAGDLDAVEKWGWYYVLLSVIGYVAITWSIWGNLTPMINKICSNLPNNLKDKGESIKSSLKKEFILASAFIFIMLFTFFKTPSVIQSFDLNLIFISNTVFYASICCYAYILRDIIGVHKVLRENEDVLIKKEVIKAE